MLVTQPQTSFWLDGGRRKAAPEEYLFGAFGLTNADKRPEVQ
jgi:hypothetical protein